MLTIEQLQAMPACERAAHVQREVDYIRACEAAAGHARREAAFQEREAADARATLEAAGLWPLPTAPKEGA